MAENREHDSFPGQVWKEKKISWKKMFGGFFDLPVLFLHLGFLFEWFSFINK